MLPCPDRIVGLLPDGLYYDSGPTYRKLLASRAVATTTNNIKNATATTAGVPSNAVRCLLMGVLLADVRTSASRRL